MKLSMVMIVRDCADEIRETINSFIHDVDELVVVDTGSTDNTMQIVRSMAGGMEGPALVTGEYEWDDDFGAVRNYADSLATGDWLSWADHDDTVVGLGNLRAMAEQADPRVEGFFCSYAYAVKDGECVCELWRERLVRKGAGVWVDRVHESQMIRGPVIRVDRETAQWVHRKPPFTPSDRNTLILERWLEDEPRNPRVLSNLARDHMSNGRAEDAVPLYERYLQQVNQPRETRAQAARQLSCALITMGRLEWAREQALRAFQDCPSWPDTYLTLAEIAAISGDWNTVIFHCEQVLRMGAPDTLLIVNPQDYESKPKAMIAHALANMGRVNEACELAEQVPDALDGLPEMLAEWQSVRQRDQTAGMWAQCAQLLVNYDEPLKAEALLDTVPHYSADHHQVIAARVQVRDAVEEPYQAQPVEGPRAEYLLRGLAEQVAA